MQNLNLKNHYKTLLEQSILQHQQERMMRILNRVSSGTITPEYSNLYTPYTPRSDVNNARLVRIGDMARRKGLPVVGTPQIGKPTPFQVQTAGHERKPATPPEIANMIKQGTLPREINTTTPKDVLARLRTQGLQRLGFI